MKLTLNNKLSPDNYEKVRQDFYMNYGEPGYYVIKVKTLNTIKSIANFNIWAATFTIRCDTEEKTRDWIINNVAPELIKNNFPDVDSIALIGILAKLKMQIMNIKVDDQTLSNLVLSDELSHIAQTLVEAAQVIKYATKDNLKNFSDNEISQQVNLAKQKAFMQFKRLHEFCKLENNTSHTMMH